jgi:ABC-type molybdate transport system permease subunit
VSVEGATISVLIGVLTGIPLAYVLAHRRGWLSSAVGVVVQLPLAVPPLICGILLIYIVGPYTFLGQLSGERLTETMYGVVIAQSFVSLPFLVVVARSAFRAVDPPSATSPPPSVTVRWPGSSASTCRPRRTVSGPG